MSRSIHGFVLWICLLAGLLACPHALSGQEWPSYGGDPGGTRFSKLEQINRSNVSRLRPAWTYHTGERRLGFPRDDSRPAAFECAPIVIDGRLFLVTPSSRVIALEAETGRELWVFDPQKGRNQRHFEQHRGAAYWQGMAEGKTSRRIFYATFDGKLIALDAMTGRPCPDFGQEGMVNLRRGVADKWPHRGYGQTSPPAIFEDLVIVGSIVPEGPGLGPSGDVRAFRAQDGSLVWTFHTVPRPGEYGHDTWEAESWKDRTGVNVWSIMSVDTKRGLVFLPIGSPAYDFYGGDRKGSNLFGNSLVALDARTGKRVWHFQMVHHDLWDYDMPAQPVLATLHQGSQEVPLAVQVNKMGMVFAFERESGRPFFPVEERPVPASKVPGESSWPTQPFPVKPSPLVRHAMTRDDITSVTPEHREFCLDLFDSLVNGPIYTPLGEQLTLQIPGTLGGATWSGASFDPQSGYLFVNVNELPMLGAIEPKVNHPDYSFVRSSPWGAYARLWNAEKVWPCIKPPWGKLVAVDLNKGEIAWSSTLGIVPELSEKKVSPTGAPNLGGSIVTAGGLVFIGSTNDSRLRAFDSNTGKELWVTRLEASGHALPVTYLGQKSRKQFVVIAAGGGGYFSKEVSDAVQAFALPDGV
ncbi:MAG: pyrroloquinoline quinone-dependent dehydrogenase [Acidobacteriota bacterium]